MKAVYASFTRSLAVIFMLICALSPAHAEEYTVGVENIDYYPLYAKRDGTYSGYARAVLDEFARR